MSSTGSIDSVVRAGIEFDGRTLRYAEVDLGSRHARLANPLKSAGPRLLRLGVCDFPFDIAEVLLGGANDRHLTTLHSALAEIFAGSRAEHLKVALHPWQAASFFVPLPMNLSPAAKVDHIRQEAALLADSTEDIGRLTATPLRTENRADGSSYLWHHVLQVPRNAYERLEYLTGAFGRKIGCGFVDASGVSSQALHVSLTDEPAAGCELLIGTFGDRVETAIIRNGTWYFSHWNASDSSADTLYFCLALLDHLRISREDITDVRVYGSEHSELQEELTSLVSGRSVPTFDPFVLFSGVQSQVDAASRSAFVPGIGAALSRS